MSQDDDEPAVQDLRDAVERVAAVLRAKTRRDALIAATPTEQRAAATRAAQVLGFKIFEVYGGAEAAASVAGRRFDLILLSAEDAPHWARRIRALPTGCAPTIIALGAPADSAWREDASEAGIDAMAPDPVTADRLTQLLVVLLGGAVVAPGEPDERREA